MRKFLRNLFSLVIIWPASIYFDNVQKAPRRRTFWQNLALLPQVYVAKWGKRYAYHLESKYGVNTGRGVCLHCHRYPCRCAEFAHEAVRADVRAHAERIARLDHEQMIAKGLCPQCGDKRDPVLGCAKHS